MIVRFAIHQGCVESQGNILQLCRKLADGGKACLILQFLKRKTKKIKKSSSLLPSELLNEEFQTIISIQLSRALNLLLSKKIRQILYPIVIYGSFLLSKS